MRHLPGQIEPVGVVAQGLVCAAGSGLPALAAVLRAGGSALSPNDFTVEHLPSWIGRMPALEQVLLPDDLQAWDCRATRLAWMGLQADGFLAAAQAACARHGAARVGLVLGTSASTIGASELAYATLAPDGGFPAPLRNERLNTLHAVTMFVQQAIGLAGPCVTVSTACSSSAKAFAQAERWLRLDLADAVVVAGVDALSRSIVFGFHALGLLSADPCRPFDAARRGISVGEAAGFALLQRGAGDWLLLGHGESNDAHHMTHPHPRGVGAEQALDGALARAGASAADVDYLNLHGTASAQNDEIEAALVARRYRGDVHASATKGASGHTMGAAGIVEALICALALRDGLLSGSAGTAAVDASLGTVFAAQLQRAPVQRRVRVAASHSFGFGGNNAVLLFRAGTA